jgi:hypothetical protein
MSTSRLERASKPVSEFTEEDLAAYDFHLEVPYFHETRKRFKAWRAKRASSRRAAHGDPVAAGEVGQGPGSVE